MWYMKPMIHLSRSLIRAQPFKRVICIPINYAKGQTDKKLTRLGYITERLFTSPPRVICRSIEHRSSRGVRDTIPRYLFHG